MTLRELLRTELWSKGTSRKIFGVLAIVFVTLGVIVLAVVLWNEVNSHWLTTKERNAGISALNRVDALQSSIELDDEQYGALEKLAAADVQVAKQAARTSRDQNLAYFLGAYLDMTNERRGEQKLALKYPKLIEDNGKQTRIFLSTELHVMIK